MRGYIGTLARVCYFELNVDATHDIDVVVLVNLFSKTYISMIDQEEGRAEIKGLLEKLEKAQGNRYSSKSPPVDEEFALHEITVNTKRFKNWLMQNKHKILVG